MMTYIFYYTTAGITSALQNKHDCIAHTAIYGDFAVGELLTGGVSIPMYKIKGAEDDTVLYTFDYVVSPKRALHLGITT